MGKLDACTESWSQSYWTIPLGWIGTLTANQVLLSSLTSQMGTNSHRQPPKFCGKLSQKSVDLIATEGDNAILMAMVLEWEVQQAHIGVKDRCQQKFPGPHQFSNKGRGQRGDYLQIFGTSSLALARRPGESVACRLTFLSAIDKSQNFLHL